MSFETRSSTNNLLAAKQKLPDVIIAIMIMQFRLNSISAKSADTISEALAAISEKHNLTYMVLFLTDHALLILLLKVAE